MERRWEDDIAGFLEELSGIQGELLDLLNRKRELLRNADGEGIASVQQLEEELTQRMQACQVRRKALLAQAAEDGLPSKNLRSLLPTLPRDARRRLERPFQEAAGKMHLLAHQSLVNWVLIQRTLLHLSQLLEIIATGGRLKPTYGKDHPIDTSGHFMDQAA